MKTHEVLAAIYEAWKLGNETPLQCFLRLERLEEGKLTGLSRSNFEKLWEQCAKYPSKHKLDVITTRQQELRNEITEAMLRVDPPWEQVVEWCQLIKEAQESPNGLPYALEGLFEYSPVLADDFKVRCEVEFPTVFKPTPDAG